MSPFKYTFRAFLILLLYYLFYKNVSQVLNVILSVIGANERVSRVIKTCFATSEMFEILKLLLKSILLLLIITFRFC